MFCPQSVAWYTRDYMYITFKTTCKVRPHFHGLMGGLKIEGPNDLYHFLYIVLVGFTTEYLWKLSSSVLPLPPFLFSNSKSHWLCSNTHCSWLRSKMNYSSPAELPVTIVLKILPFSHLAFLRVWDPVECTINIQISQMIPFTRHELFSGGQRFFLLKIIRV